MKKKLIRIIKMTAYLSIMGIILQALFVNMIFAATPANAQNLSNIRITLEVKNVPLKTALEQIQQQTGYKFVYSKSEIPLNGNTTIVATDETLENVLRDLAEQHNITFKQINRQIVIKKAEVNDKVYDGKPNTKVFGEVTNAETGEPLIGANIVIKGTDKGASTDAKGKFVITGLAPGEYTIVANYIGFVKREEKIKVIANRAVEVNFELQPSLLDLNEVVVTGSQSGRQKRALANPVTAISDDELKFMSIDKIDDLFEGRVPGGYSLELDFQNRKSQTIALRGSQSFNSYNNNVKMYIDGVEVADYSFSPINTLDYNDIERIEILRGPMASTLYGSGSSGGVIQIFTKKGIRSGTKIRFKSYVTTTSTPYVDKTPIGQYYSLGLSSGTPDKGFHFGLYRSISQLPYPNNGIDDKDWKLNGGLNMRSGPFSIDLKASYGTSVYGSVNNPYILELSKERGWTALPSFYKDIRDHKYSSNDQRASINLRHVISDKWYQNLTLGFDKTSYKNVALSSSNDKYQYLDRTWAKNTISWFINTKQNLMQDITADVTAGIEHTIQNSNYLNSKLDVVPEDIRAKPLLSGIVNNYGYSNTGYYGEAVFGYKNKLYFTAGMRFEDNSYYGDEYGLDKNPRVGLSYIFEKNGFVLKPRISWGSSSTAPKEFQKEYQKTTFVTILANPNLGPESQSGYEAGLDLYYREWASLEITYYNQVVKNGITGVNVDDPNTPEREVQYQNINEFFNKGWEFAGKVLLNPVSVNFTFTIINSEYGKNAFNTDPDNVDWRYKEGARKLYTPDYTGFLGISYKVPAILPFSNKGGNIGVNVTYTGKMLIVNTLRLYDGYYNPNIDRISSRDKEYLTEKEGFFKINFRSSYWITDYASIFFNVDNLTDYQKGGYSNVTPSIGRVIKAGLEFLF